MRVIQALLFKETAYMKRFLIAATLAAAALSASLPATAQVSVSIGQPGFYGRLDIGGFPTPALLFPEPVMIQRVPSGRPPLYLRVPPAMPGIGAGIAIVTARVASAFISFQDNWYRQEYAPRYRERHVGYRNDYRGEERRNYRRQERHEERRDYRREERRDFRGDDWGPGNGRGHGHGHGRDD